MSACGRKACFFEKKQQKTSGRFCVGLSGNAPPNSPKFFGSFFRKSTASFPA
jgi:hypothetical protein